MILSKKNLIGEKNGKIRRRKLRYFAVLIFLRGGYLPAKKNLSNWHIFVIRAL